MASKPKKTAAQQKRQTSPAANKAREEAANAPTQGQREEAETTLSNLTETPAGEEGDTPTQKKQEEDNRSEEQKKTQAANERAAAAHAQRKLPGGRVSAKPTTGPLDGQMSQADKDRMNRVVPGQYPQNMADNPAQNNIENVSKSMDPREGSNNKPNPLP